MRVIVEITGADPHGLREQCEEWCTENLPRGIMDRDEVAAAMLAEFMKTIDPRTTGADRLSVAIVEREPAAT